MTAFYSLNERTQDTSTYVLACVHHTSHLTIPASEATDFCTPRILCFSEKPRHGLPCSLVSTAGVSSVTAFSSFSSASSSSSGISCISIPHLWLPPSQESLTACRDESTMSNEPPTCSCIQCSSLKCPDNNSSFQVLHSLVGLKRFW